MFDDIRPYRDEEVVPILKKLINEKELQSIVAKYVMPKLYRLFPWLCRNLVKLSFSYRVRKFVCVETLQKEIVKYLNRLIKRSTNGFSYHGLADIDMSKPTLFVSNHRDIALDPALVNYALYQSGSSTAEIAIGDNLLSKPWLSDLMRLNKSFIVKRGEKSKREMLNASKNLSAYIHHTLTEKKQHVWIAQREGRAKNGLDKTNPAVISMLLLNRQKQQSISDYLKEINIVPVAISYEFDPCDRDKAIELAAIETSGSYKKSEYEDIKSISKGMLGFKGKIHVEFGTALKGEYPDSKSIAEEIDRQITHNYKLTGTNYAAYRLLHNQQSNPNELTSQNELTAHNELTTLTNRMLDLDDIQKNFLIQMYANPVLVKTKN